MDKDIALVTGSSRGIGKAVALRLASDGVHVFLNYRTREKEAGKVLEEIEKKGGSGELLGFDVADHEACQAALDLAFEKHGTLDILVNNAGIRNDMLMVWMEEPDWNRVIDTNLSSFYNVTRHVVKNMVMARKGRIITISSTSGQSGMAGQTNYAASKAGLIGASKSLAREVAKRGVTVNVVSPGFIETEMVEDMPKKEILATLPMARFGRPEEVASAVSFLCQDDAGYITGAVINVNGGAYT